ncbi:hypothetical protein ACRRTK_021746 [Alexandromys fortis]
MDALLHRSSVNALLHHPSVNALLHHPSVTCCTVPGLNEHSASIPSPVLHSQQSSVSLLYLWIFFSGYFI